MLELHKKLPPHLTGYSTPQLIRKVFRRRTRLPAQTQAVPRLRQVPAAESSGIRGKPLLQLA